MNMLVIVGSVVFLLIVGVAIYPVFRLIPYAYGMARVRAARAKMFRDDELQSLAGESYKDAIYRLEKRGLTDLLDLIDSDFREDLVQKRLAEDYLFEIERISKFVPQSKRKFFLALKERSVYDLIVAVIRSKTSPYYDRHVIEDCFVETSFLKQSELDRIEKMTVDDFISRLKGTKYFEVVNDHLEEIKKGDLVAFEEDVNARRFAKLKSIAGSDETLRKYTKLEIDIHNIRHAACFGDRSFLEGGSLSENVHKDLAQVKNLDDIKRALDKTRFAEYLQSADSTISLERGLLKIQKDFARTLLASQPLSIDPILAYYIEKHIELRNIRILLKLIYARFAPEEIRGMLV